MPLRSGRFLGLGLDRIPRGLHCLFGVAFLALEVLLPQGLADLELGQAELLVRNGLGNLELIDDQRHPVLPPLWLGLVPLVVVRRVWRDLTRMGRLRTRNRVLPDAIVEGQRLHVLGGFVLVLAVLEQTRASGPEDRRAQATAFSDRATSRQSAAARFDISRSTLPAGQQRRLRLACCSLPRLSCPRSGCWAGRRPSSSS